MASNKTFSEIIEIADTLDRQFLELQNDAKRRYDLYTLRKSPIIPDDIAREGQVNIISPLVPHSAHTIRADLMMNPTEFTVVPLARETDGRIPKEHERLADNLEKSLAIIWGNLNDGRRIDREIIWHQLCSPFGVMLLECGEIDFPDQPDNMSDKEYVSLLNRHRLQLMPWSISTPDPLTCSFLEYKGKPTIATRRYKQLVREVKRTYSKRGGTDHYDQNLVLKDGIWVWEGLSEDYPKEEYRHQTAEDIQEVEMVWLDDGDNIYIVAMNPINRDTKGKSGQVVWSGKNPIGRVSMFIVGSNTTPLRNPEDRWEPYLWSLMQVVDQLNTIRTIRATSARNESGPDNYIALDPQVVELYMANGKELPKIQQWKRDGSVPFIPGELKTREVVTSVDYDKLEMQINQDLQRLLPPSSVNVLDPAVIKAATASAILHAAEAGVRMYGPLMSAYDAQIKEVMLGILHSIEYYYEDETFYTFAEGDEVAGGRNLKAGQRYVLNSETLDFPYRVNVKTRSMSQAQASAQYELALKQRLLPDGSPGPMTLPDILDAANISDKAAQMEKIAEEQILMGIDPYLQQFALSRAIVEIEYKTGIKLPIGGDPSMQGGAPAEGGGMTPQGSQNVNNAQRMDAPYITGPSGGSNPTEVNPLMGAS